MDARGHRAEMIMDDKSIIKRMNLGVPYEMYFNSVLIHVEEDCKTLLGLDPTKRLSIDYYDNRLNNPAQEEKAVGMIIDLLKIISPIQHDVLVEEIRKNPSYAREFLLYALHEGIRPYMPPNNPVQYDKAVREIEKRFQPLYGPVTYRGKSGNLVTTEDPVRIADQYVMLLEKVTDDAAAVSSTKRQHYAVPAKVSNYDRHANPFRQQPTRVVGESEGRNYVANVSPRATADMIDRSTNPTVHRQVCESIINAPQPTAIASNVDRAQYPIGHGRIQMFIRHIMECDGLRFTRYPLNPGDED